MSTNKQTPKQTKKISNGKKDTDDKSLSTERWIEPNESLSKDHKMHQPSAGEKVKPNPHSVPKVDEQEWAKKIVNEQEQNNITNQQEATEQPDAEQPNRKELDADDFPEADQSTDQPFRKVPTMDA